MRSRAGVICALRVGGQFGTFAMVGVLATGVYYVLLVAQVLLLGSPAWQASAIGCLAGAATSYIVNRRLTFRSNIAHARSVPRFIAVAGASLLLNTIIVAFLVRMHIHYLAAQFLATSVVLVWNFVLNRNWTFKARL